MINDKPINNTINPKLKHQQLAEYILLLIEKGEIHIGDRLPSIKQLQETLTMSKETVLKGLNHLTEKGIIESVYRKGYYLTKKAVHHKFHVFLLFDKMNLLREKIYQSLFNELKDVADIDIYFHHHNAKVFEKLIRENLGKYTHFVIATFLKDDVSSIINEIPAKKRIILDYNQKGLSGDYSCIYQDFEYDIYQSLKRLKNNVSAYKKIILIAHPEASHAKHVIDGFINFCSEHKMPYIIQPEIDKKDFKKHTAYITFSRYDTDDVTILKLARKHNYILGKDIGLISYNDTDVKEILEGGITVISTDFEAMGKSAAKSIKENRIITKRNSTKVIIRNSL